jgi:hypothetical protein
MFGIWQVHDPAVKLQGWDHSLNWLVSNFLVCPLGSEAGDIAWRGVLPAAITGPCGSYTTNKTARVCAKSVLQPLICVVP